MSKRANRWGPDHQLLPPCLLTEWRLKHKDKKQQRPCVVFILLFKNRHRHSLLSQTQRINTALVKVDPFKFPPWGLQRGWGSPGLCIKSRNFTSTVCSFEPSSLFSFQLFSSMIFIFLFIRSLQSTFNDLERKKKKLNLFQPQGN